MRVALVTGSSRGIGKATIQRLAKDFDGVVVHYRRNHEAAESVAEELRAGGTKVLVAAAELEDPEALAAMVDAVRAEFGHLDVLVANAAAGKFAPVLAQSDVNIARTFDTIVGGFVRLVRLSLPLMPAGGRIIAVSGLDSRVALPLHGVIGAAKAALESLVRQLSFELAEYGVTVNSVVPGSIETDSAAFQRAKTPELDDTLNATNPASRFADPDEVAGVIAFLCGPDASYISGASLVVDGGMSAGGGPWGAMVLQHAKATGVAR